MSPWPPGDPGATILEQALGLQACFHGHPPPVYRPWAGRDGHCQVGSRARGPPSGACTGPGMGSGCVAVPPARVAGTKVEFTASSGAAIPKASCILQTQQARVQAWLAWAGAPAVGRVDAGGASWISGQDVYSVNREARGLGGRVSLGPQRPGRRPSVSTVRAGEGASIPLQPCVSITQRARPAGEKWARQPPQRPAQAGRHACT